MIRIGNTMGQKQFEQYAYIPKRERVIIRRYHVNQDSEYFRNNKEDEYDFVDLSLEDLYKLIELIKDKPVK